MDGSSRGIVILNADLKNEDVILGRRYVRAVERAGGVPLVLPVMEEDFTPIFQFADSLLLVGGKDLDPRLYSGPLSPQTMLMNPERQDFDLRLLKEALRRKVRLLAICGGLQELNVAHGGSLHQHIEGHNRVEHKVQVVEGTLLKAVVGEEWLVVPSNHHQSVSRLGSDLRLSALAEDQTIEAIEHNSLPIIGVQWHPERKEDPATRRLFRWLVTGELESRNARA